MCYDAFMLTKLHRNPMTVEFSQELEPLLREYADVLQIQSTFVTEEEIMDRYLKRAFGNAYDFDQMNRLQISI